MSFIRWPTPDELLPVYDWKPQPITPLPEVTELPADTGMDQFRLAQGLANALRLVHTTQERP